KMLKFNRYFTRPGHDVLGQAERKKIAIKGFDGPIEAPMRWSQTAVEVAAQKYFRKRGVGPHAGSETSVFQLLHRVVESIARAGAWQGYFNDSATEQAFKDELSHILLHQMGSFNSPVYFNVGIFPEYQIAGHGENYYFDRTSEKVLELNT